MSKKVLRVIFALLATLLMFVLLFSGVCWAQSSSNEIRQNRTGLQRQVSGNVFDVAIWVFLSGRYEFWDLNIRNEIVVSMTVNLTEPIPTPYIISTRVPFSLIEVTGLPSGANYTYGFWGYPPVGTLSIHITTNVSSFSIKLRGYVAGHSVFWRNAADMPLFLNVTSPIGYISSYMLVLIPPSTSRILKVYNRLYGDLPYREISLEGQRGLIVTLPYPFIVLYDPETWETYALIVMFVTILMVFVVPYALRSRKIGAMLSGVMGRFHKSSPLKMMTNFRQLYNKVREMDSSKLLTAYILCALLMTSLSYAVGPDPRLKVYVLASTQENAQTISSFVYKEADAVAITIFDEVSEFETLMDIGVLSAVIVGDFFPPEGGMVKGYIYPALNMMPSCYKSIIILKNYAFDVFSSEIQMRYSDRTIVVEDLAALAPVFSEIPRRRNALGLNVSPEMYFGVSAFVGLCSFIIFFFGLAFLACKLIEVGKKPLIGGFPEAIAYAILVFFFTQAIYIICSVLLAIPLGLHTSSPKVTAIGFMGFGGGSRPRIFAGLAGFLVGSLISLKEGPKLDKAGFLSFLLVSFFVVIDPLTSGVIFYEFILLYTVGPYAFEPAATTMSYIKDFLAYTGDAFGGWVSPVYAISTGIILYYAGAIPICLFPKLRKSTATLLLLFCVFCTAAGGFRVANMRPWSTIACIAPGLMVGLIATALFCFISFIEMIIRMKIGKEVSI